MNQSSLAVFLFGYRLDAILYPWRASIASALDLAGESGAVYFCVCDDDTYAAVVKDFTMEIDEGRLWILGHEWGSHYSVQAHIANFMLDKIGTQYDFALKLDADEVLCEWSFDAFREDLEIMAQDGWRLGRPHYTHLCPDDKHVFDFIYRSKAVLSRTTAGFRFSTGRGGDACALGGAPEYQTRLEIMHLGKMEMGREREALAKEHEFQKLYVELGFPDPKVEALLSQGYMDYLKVFDRAWANGEFRNYHGPYPKYVIDYLATMRERSIAFWRDLEEGKAAVK